MWSRYARNAAHVTVGRRSRGDVMGGTADGGQTASQDALSDLVSVRAAAHTSGVTTTVVEGWIDRGRLTAQTHLAGHRVSLAAVRALCAILDAQTSAEARPITDVTHTVGVSISRIRIWAQRGLLPSWRGRHGLLVRESDVRALAQQHAATPLAPSDKAGA